MECRTGGTGRGDWVWEGASATARDIDRSEGGARVSVVRGPCKDFLHARLPLSSLVVPVTPA